MLNSGNKIIGISVTLLLVLATYIYGQENPEQSYGLEFEWQKSFTDKQEKNIKDYFLLLPSEIINCEGAQIGAFSTQDKRESFIKEVDLKNGYLVFGNKAQLVLFKDRDKSKDIIAIQSGGCGSGNTCGAYNTLMELDNTTWKFRVDLLPKGKTLEQIYISKNVCPYFDLPQYGTTILVKDEDNNDSIIAKYLWKDGKFIFDK